MTDEFEEEHFEEKPFLEHLEDLRMTLFKIIVTTIVGALVCLAVRNQIFVILTRPIDKSASLAFEEKLPTKNDKSQDPAQTETEPTPNPSPAPAPPETRIVVTGPFGGLVMLAWDLFICSREAVSFLKPGASDLTDADQKQSAKEPAKPHKPALRPKNKSSSQNKKKPPVIHIMITGPAKGFVILMKTAFICGLGITLPLNIFFLAQFVFPALTRKEKKYVTPAFLIGGVLFALGLLFGYFVTVPLAMNILARVNASIPVGTRAFVENRWELNQYLSTVTKLLIANGVIFEMPLLLTLLVRIGVLTVETLRRKRKHAIVVMLFVAAMLSPPDAPTMFLVAAPMLVMYEACIWVSWFLMRKKRRREKEDEQRESYWDERKRMKLAEKVEPEEERKEAPADQPPEEQDYGPSPDESGEDYPYGDQGGHEEWPEEGQDGQDDLDSDSLPPDDEKDPDRRDD